MGTQGYGINLRMRRGESILRCEGEPPTARVPNAANHLVEAVSDSNFASDRATRKSLSSGQIYVDGALVFSFVRSQKVVTTSSGEAELVALTQTVGEAILVRKAVAFLQGVRPEDVNLVARTDSSVARAIASRNGVGRVKHLATSCLWLQGWVARKELRIAAVPTEVNPADLGTKVLAAKRLMMLLFILGMVADNGERVGEGEYLERRGRSGPQNSRVVRLAQMLVAMSLQGCAVQGDNEDLIESLLVKFAFMLEYLNTVTAGNQVTLIFLIGLLTGMMMMFVGGRWQYSLKVEFATNQGLESATGKPPTAGEGRPWARTPIHRRDLVEGRSQGPQRAQRPEPQRAQSPEPQRAQSQEPQRAQSQEPRAQSREPQRTQSREPREQSRVHGDIFSVAEESGSLGATRAPAIEIPGGESSRTSTSTRSEGRADPREGQQSGQFLGGGNPRPAGQADVQEMIGRAWASVTQPAAKANPVPENATPRGYMVIAPGARQDPEPREGGEALVMTETDNVSYALSRGYAFHLPGCRNLRGSARRTKTVSLREALLMELQPAQCCTAGRVHVV